MHHNLLLLVVLSFSVIHVVNRRKDETKTFRAVGKVGCVLVLLVRTKAENDTFSLV